MPCSDPAKSRATHYIQVYELKPGRITTLAETKQTKFASPDQFVEKDITTQFIDETLQDSHEIAPVDMVQSIYESVHVEGTDTLKGYLEKPTMIAAGVFQTSDVAGVPVNVWSFPSEFVLRAKNANKLKGIFGYRADMEFTLKVNGTRFTQGNYIARIVYLGGAGTSVSVTKVAAAHVGNLVLATSGPRYNIDIATQTSITFVVPYTSVANYSLVDYSSTYARDSFKLYLIPYDPLQAGSGDSTVQWSLWTRFVNITTTGNVVLQSGGSIELKKAGLGPVSGVADKISRTASIFGAVPLLQPFTSTVGWMANLVKSAAIVWGFSKPTAADPPHNFVRKTAPHSSNGDGVFTGHKLTLMSSSEVPVTTGRQRTRVDEMSFDFIKKQPAWFKTVAWLDTQTSGTLVTSFAVGPSSNYVPLYKGNTYPPCDYLAFPFTFWRGSYKLKMTIPKTEFHSGRLAIVVLPVEAGASFAAPANLADTDNLARVIWDVRESNELEIEVPFVQTRNFIETSKPSAYVYVFVVNELIAPSTVSSQVNILFEKRGCDSLEYAAPVGSTTNDTYYEPYIYFQSADVGLTKSPPLVEAESFGEAIRSLRTLLKRSSLFYLGYPTPCFRITIDPYVSVCTMQLTSTAGALTRLAAKADLISLYSMCFAMSSGSTRFNVALNPAALNNTSVTSEPVAGNGVDTPLAYAYQYQNTQVPRALISTPVEGVVSFEAPAYQSFGARSVASRVIGPTTVFSSAPSGDLGGANQTVSINASADFALGTNGVMIYRSAGEDFSLSVWNGTFPVVISNAS